MASEQGDVEPGDLAQEQSGPRTPLQETPLSRYGKGSAGRGRSRGISQLVDSVRPGEKEVERGIKTDPSSQFSPASAPATDMSAVLIHFLQAQQDREEMRLRMQEEREEKRWKLLLDREDERRKADIVHQERWIEAEEARRKHEDEERLRRERRIEGLKLNPLEDRDNVDDYLNQFERIAELQGWEKETWSSHLLPYLTGIARSLYFALRPEEQNNYDSLRAALMKRFNLTADGYRRKFREARKETGETFEQFIVRLDGYFQKWASLSNKDVNKVEDLKDLIIAEQFMETLSTDLAIRVRERQPANVQEAARAADVVVEAKKSTRKVQMSGTSSSSSKGQGNDKVKDSKSVGLESDSLRVAREKGLCFKCKKPGHMKKDCKMAATVLSSPRKRVQKVPALCKRCSAKVFHPRCMVRLNGREAEALRDTGADSLIVDSTLVSPTMFTGKKKCITLASTGHQELCDTAHVMLESPFFTGKALALVMENSLVPVIIGNQVELEPGRECRVPVYSVDPEVGAVETRAMAHKKRTPEKPLPASKPLIGQIGPEQVLQMQQDDDTLKRVRENAESGQQFKVRSCTVHFEKRKKLLYRVYSGPTGSYSQLVVPKSLRDEVMHLAHDSAMAGHMAAKKTRERVWQSFYWPGMCSDIRRYCSSCDQCQRTISRGLIKKAPLEKMPLLDEPFRRVAVDLVGPITPASERGYRYILVMVDYATRYPEAVPLKSIETETVAEALFDMWSRLGIPAEVLSDQGTQFVSNVMKEVQRLLSVQGISTTPYHAQCNGLVERFNATLKSMLKRLCLEKPKTWDRYLPAILFAYREVPQESTGFAPFELLYGRTVRGPMHVLRQLWTKEVEDEEVKTASQYVVDLRNKIEETCEIARQSLAEAAQVHKKAFDKKAVQRSLKIGDKVLLLLPEKKNKLQMSWKGPYLVIGKKGLNDYIVKVKEREKLYHINLLKKYTDRTEENRKAATVVVEEEPEEVGYTSSEIPLLPLQAEEGPEDVNLDPQNADMHQELREVCSEFSDVLTDVPLLTTLDECEVVMSTDKPIRTPQYPLPHATRDIIKEVDNMLKLNVIERAASPYSSPIVLVKKKDKKIRFCVDFRKINKSVVFDAEPMPDVDFLFAMIGKAKYLSKLDLSKGYWQTKALEQFFCRTRDKDSSLSPMPAGNSKELN
ncbi:uncharacterized protein LOC143300003 [Babylonia areolata]|uniref:uncharacterized protein LOC143300003 n=1 Tax=Babylonia areolata TaxID=304850 RepID=UPI003FD4B4CF